MAENENDVFPSTHWTLIGRLKSQDEGQARLALNEICALYHYPLYCYIRRRGLNHHDSEDALQDFMAKLLRLNAFDNASQESGRLRGLLVVSLQRFLINIKQRVATKQQEKAVSFDDPNLALADDERRYLKEKESGFETPEIAFERQWARELLQHVLTQLEARYVARGKGELFNALRPVLLAGGNLSGEEVERFATLLKMNSMAVKMSHSRLLKNYRKLLQNEVAKTVSDPADVESEIIYLMGLFARK